MRVPQWVVPVLVVILASGGIFVAQLFAIPTVEVDLAPDAETPQGSVVVTLSVRGVRCASAPWMEDK